MKKFLSLWMNYNKAKPFPGIVNFLVTNPMFRRMAQKYHDEKTEATESLDQWLEKELLTKE